MKVISGALAVTGVLLAATAQAQSFCDLVPASAVAATLGIPANFAAKPNVQGGNGCDYKGEAGKPDIAVADASDDSGMMKTLSDMRFKSLGPNDERVSGIGDAAIYYGKTVAYPRLAEPQYFQQGIVIRAKGKYVSFEVTLPGNKGVPKAAMLSLGQLIVSKPIDTLKDPAPH
ncbi:MAG: hypothetical protein ACLQO1_21830 [Steroidobacteraceae bacterium]